MPSKPLGLPCCVVQVLVLVLALIHTSATALSSCRFGLALHAPPPPLPPRPLSSPLHGDMLTHFRAAVAGCRGSHELEQAVDTLQQALRSCSLLPEDLCPQLLDACCTTQGSRPVDLLVRTSGEQRLSDFLPFQARNALLHWSDTLWPDFGFVHLLEAVREWQGAAPVLQQLAAAAKTAGIAEGGQQANSEGVLRRGSASSGTSEQGQASIGADDSSGSSSSSMWSLVSRPADSTQALQRSGVVTSLGGYLCDLFSGNLSAIREEGPCHCPHPSQQLRKAGFLQWLHASNQAWLESAAAG